MKLLKRILNSLKRNKRYISHTEEILREYEKQYTNQEE